MANIKELIENKQVLDYSVLCKALIQQFGVNELVNFDSVLPASQQQELFGGEVLRLVNTHPTLANQKDIRPIALKRGSISQMLFFYICLADSTLPKKHIEQITKRFIKGQDANRYIIWFFGNKAATEMKVVLSGREGKKVVLKTLSFGTNQPYYKTYDFILAEVALKVQQLFVEPTDLWKALWKAFDISIVNRKFYDEIKQAFDSLLLQIRGNGNPFKNDEDRVQFAIRMIGRIIFCWFLKRKDILKDEALSSKAVLNYKDKNYYHELLELLFFEVMNKPGKERISGLPKIIAQYPFLNGGLFDASKETDFYDANKSSPDFRLSIDNDWFHRFFSVTLEKYNFTVDENSSSNAEIAIDPEMLGRVFENLLAEQNPETGESARNATGSFYTPREIVEYMVEQSIAEYLKTALNKSNYEPIPEANLFGVITGQQLKLPTATTNAAIDKQNEAIEDFVHTTHLPDELKQRAQSLLDALNAVKVLDPACGSGAFPIGVLQKLIALKQEITQVQNPKKQLSQAATYKLKLDTIQNSIYGIDIQPMAVELSRLRCWLSLVVDEDNDNIKALPNLDFKFVCADSLVDVPENEYVRTQSQKSLDEFTAATAQYFNPDYAQKTELKVTIKRCLNEITNTHDSAISLIITQLRKERNSASATRLKTLEKNLEKYTKEQSVWHSYRNIFENKKVEFFNLLYFFPLAKNGFDIVIGNPPYVQLQSNGGHLANIYAGENFKTFARTGDIYALFYEKGFHLLRNKGILCFITSNKWMRAAYGEKLREYFISQTNPLWLIDFGGHKIFDATVDTNILVAEKSSFQNKVNACVLNKSFSLDNMSDYFRQNSSIRTFTNNSWVVLDDTEQLIKQKIEKVGKPLKNWDIHIYRGILTGYNEAFIIDTATRDKLVAASPNSAEIIRPILKGKHIKKYGLLNQKEWVIIFPCGWTNKKRGAKNPEIFFKEFYPEIYNHLIEKSLMPSKGKGLFERDDQGDYWWELRPCVYLPEFEKEKILYIDIMTDNEKEGYPFPCFSYAKNGVFTLNTAYFMVGNNNHLKYILGLLNSKTGKFIVKSTVTPLQKRQYRMFQQFVEKFVIPIAMKNDEKKVIDLVDEIINRKNENMDTLSQEMEIEAIVHKICGFTDSEIEFIMCQE